MSNFIGLVFATLKNEGVDTKGMSTDEAVKKYNELQQKSGGKAGEKEPTPAENRKMSAGKGGDGNDDEPKDTPAEEKVSKEYKKDTSIENNMEIDWDLAERNEKINGNNVKNPNRHDKYGNELLSDEAFEVGLEAGKSYLAYQEKYGNDVQKLKKSNVFFSGLQEIIGNAITNNGFDPNQDVTYTDYNQIIGNLIGEEVDTEKYEGRQGSGFTGRKYIDYTPSKKK